MNEILDKNVLCDLNCINEKCDHYNTYVFPYLGKKGEEVEVVCRYCNNKYKVIL